MSAGGLAPFWGSFMKPVMLDFPEEFETERLVIRAPRPGDGVEMSQAVNESLSELRLWLPWATKMQSAEESEEFLRQSRLRFLAREDLQLVLFLKGSNTIVGSSGLHRFNWEVPRFEIGYWIRTKFAGQGFCREAVNGISKFAFETLKAKRLEIHIDPRNVKSRRVAERAGYILEANLHNYARDVDAELRDTLIYVKFSL